MGSYPSSHSTRYTRGRRPEFDSNRFGETRPIFMIGWGSVSPPGDSHRGCVSSFWRGNPCSAILLSFGTGFLPLFAFSDPERVAAKILRARASGTFRRSVRSGSTAETPSAAGRTRIPGRFVAAWVSPSTGRTRLLSPETRRMMEQAGGCVVGRYRLAGWRVGVLMVPITVFPTRDGLPVGLFLQGSTSGASSRLRSRESAR